MITDTQTITKIVNTAVKAALEAKEIKCKMHEDRLDKFEANQADMLKGNNEINKTLAVISDNIAGIKKDIPELYTKFNSINVNTAVQDNKLITFENNINEIKQKQREDSAMRTTAFVAIGAVILEFIFSILLWRK